MGMMPPGAHGPVIWWGGWGRGRRKPDSGPANSGLTGDPALEPPQPPEGPKDLRGRWESLKQSVLGTTAALPEVLRLVWDASQRITIGLFLTTAIAGLVPTISVGITFMLTNAVVVGITNHQQHLPDQVTFASLGVHWLPWPTLSAVGMIVLLSVFQLLVFAMSALLNTLRNIFQQLLQNSVSMRIQLMVMEKAASLDLPFYEDPASYDLLRRAQNDSINRPVLMIATAFGLLQTVLTFSTMIVLLIGVSPLLALIALLSPIPAFIADTRYGWRGYNIARWGSRLLRRMTYLVNLVTTDSFAKEVKLFGLGGYFIERYRLIATAFYDSQRSQVVRRYLTGFALGNLSTIVTSLTYLYVALQAIAGRLTLGHLTAYTQAATSVQNSIQSIRSRFAARSASSTSASPIRGRSPRPSATSRSPSRRGRRWPSSAATAPGRRRCSSSSAASTTRSRAASSSTASTCATSSLRKSGARSAPCSRTTWITRRPRPRTSAWAACPRSPIETPSSARASRQDRTS